MKGQKLLIGGLAVIAMFITACTKDAPFKALPKSKQLVDLTQLDAMKEDQFRKLSQKLNAEEVVKDDWLSVTSYGKSSRSSSEARPFWMGSEHLVRFVKTKDSLVLTTIEEDTRFQGNPTNHRPILSIPAKYLNYRCAGDAFGECTNQEEEDNDTPWEDRRFAELEFGKAEFLSQEVLPLELSNLFDGCFAETKSDLTGLSIENGSLNIQLEKTMKVANITPDCLGKAHGIGINDLSFKVQYSHSIVKMDKLISQKYDRIFYPGDDEFTFGFFTTVVDKLAIDNRDVQNGQVTYMNRWNPARGAVPYHLSSDFYKPENRVLLEATHHAVQSINTALSKAGSPMSISLSSDQNVDPNDLRNNTIVLVEDPANSGVIGYGPSVANPRTGEIVHARTVMYGGVIKQLINRAYEEVRLQILEENARQAEIAASIPVDQHIDVPHWGPEPVPVSDAKDLENGRLVRKQVMAGFEELAKKSKVGRRVTLNFQKDLKKHNEFVKAQKNINFHAHSHGPAVRDLVEFKRDKKVELTLADKIRLSHRENLDNGAGILMEEQLRKDWSKDCFYDGETASLSVIRKILSEREASPRPWAQLSDSEKQEIIDLVLPEVWITTLVHELGHNLGLRHNFAGSEDKPNFYSVEELAALGIKDEVIPYSSMMEYTYRTVGALPTMGKYDIAALKFGYERKLDLADGQTAEFTKVDGKPVIKIGAQIIPVPDERVQTIATLQANGIELKEFKFCTDDMVGANPGCKRFDEGTTFSEIAEHLIKSYNEMYKFRYKRNDRRDFSIIDESARASRTAGLLMDMRVFFEVVERIKNVFRIEMDSEDWKDPFLADLRAAAVISGKFLANVMLTPDIHCTVSLADDAKSVIEVFQLKDLSSQLMTCFDPRIKALVKQVGESQDPPQSWIVSGQGGRTFQTLRDPNNPDASVDQVDVQGIWADKLIAQDMLLSRETGFFSFDKFEENFLSIPELRADILGALGSVTTNEVSVPVEFRTESGIVQSFKVKVTDPETEEEKEEIVRALPISFSIAEDNHIIQKPIMRGFRRALGLPEQQTTYQRQTLVSLAKQLPSQLDDTAEDLLNLFSIYRSIPSNGMHPVSDYLIADIGSKRYASLPENAIALATLADVRSSQVMSRLTPIELLSIALSLEPTEETASQFAQRAAKLFRKIDNSGQAAPADAAIVKELGFNAILRFATDEMATAEKANGIVKNLL